MSKNNENVQVSAIESKFARVALMIVSMLLIFAGPTYVPYLMSDILKVDYVASNVLGIGLFIVGLVLLIYLIRKRVIE
jgi:hypothetical protein